MIYPFRSDFSDTPTSTLLRHPDRFLLAAVPIRPTEESTLLLQARDAYEREYIPKKIEEARNNIGHAAELLGLECSSLYR